jgi:hypothetical protein
MPRRTGKLVLQTEPPRARIQPDGNLRLTGPEDEGAIRRERTAARVTVQGEPPAAVERPPRRQVPKRRSPRRRAPKQGWLWVSTRPAYAEVYLGKRRLGITPCRVQLAAGTHLIRLVNPSLGLSLRKRITVKPGRQADLVLHDFKQD